VVKTQNAGHVIDIFAIEDHHPFPPLYYKQIATGQNSHFENRKPLETQDEF
jgi:hypothetical protein